MLSAWGIHDLPLFLAAGLMLNLTPGPDMLFVAGSTAAAGRRAGALAALGVGAGCLVHVTLAALGVSALLATSELAFTVLKWLGAAYLVWMGVNMLRPVRPRPAGEALNELQVPAGIDTRRVFWRGALTNALNPKVALFFLAFLPQFIAPQAGHQAAAFLLLGLLFTVNGTLVTLAVAWLTGAARERLSSGRAARPGLGGWLKRGAGAVFVLLGVKLALGVR